MCNTSCCSHVVPLLPSQKKSHLPLNSNSSKYPLNPTLFLLRFCPLLFLILSVSIGFSHKFLKTLKQLYLKTQNKETSLISPEPSLQCSLSLSPVSKHFSILSLVPHLPLPGLSLTYQESVQVREGGRSSSTQGARRGMLDFSFPLLTPWLGHSVQDTYYTTSHCSPV